MTRRPAPRFPYTKALGAILPDWEVSLAFVTPKHALSLNKTLRKKDYVPNVLSYVTGNKSGEVIVCLSEAKKQAPTFELSYPHFVALLFIHACLHLKGRRHGTTMERMERALLARILTRTTTDETPHRNRDRHRHA